MTTNGTLSTYPCLHSAKKRLIEPSTLEIVECKNWCGEKSTCQFRKLRFDPSVRKFPGRRKWQPAAVFLPEKIPGTEEPGGLQPMGSQKSQTGQSTD